MSLQMAFRGKRTPSTQLIYFFVLAGEKWTQTSGYLPSGVTAAVHTLIYGRKHKPVSKEESDRCTDKIIHFFILALFLAILQVMCLWTRM